MVEDTKESHSDTRLFMGLVLGGAATFSVAVAIGVVLDATPGSLAEWVGGVSTFAALLAASYAAVQAGRVLQLERARDEIRDRAARQHQAELVAVWAGQIESQGPLVTVELVPGQPTRQTQAPGVVHPIKMPVTVRNASLLPIYGLSVEVYVGEQGNPQLAGWHEVTTVEHGRAIVGTLRDVDITTPELIESMKPVIAAVQGFKQEPPRVTIGWSFKDNAGIWWRHRPDGRLEDLGDTNPWPSRT